MVKKDFNYFFLKGNKYFFRSCKEMETIFYHYAENHVEELKFRNECVVSGNEFNEFILRKFDYNLGRIYRPFCSTYVKTLSLVECPLYSKQLITWKK